MKQLLLGSIFAVLLTASAHAQNPSPQSGDRIILDSRVTLQQAMTLDQMEEAILGRQGNGPNHPGLETDPWSLALNIDGNGTRAVRRTWRAFCCGDADGNGYLQPRMGDFGSSPKEIYIQWKQKLGRTPTGGGIGTPETFQVHNPADVGHNAGRKNMLVLRDVPNDPGSGNGRFDYLWYGAGGIAVGLSNNVPASVFNPQWFARPGTAPHLGQVMLQTLHLRAASAPGANDSREALYVNGVLIKERIGGMNEWGFNRVQFPSTFRSPAQDQTEYFWDLVIWEPGKGGTQSSPVTTPVAPSNLMLK